jgi:hypothetical protein
MTDPERIPERIPEHTIGLTDDTIPGRVRCAQGGCRLVGAVIAGPGSFSVSELLSRLRVHVREARRPPRVGGNVSPRGTIITNGTGRPVARRPSEGLQ